MSNITELRNMTPKFIGQTLIENQIEELKGLQAELRMTRISRKALKMHVSQMNKNHKVIVQNLKDIFGGNRL